MLNDLNSNLIRCFNISLLDIKKIRSDFREYFISKYLHINIPKGFNG